MKTKDICEKLNITPKMLRVYEQKNLIKPKRSSNNYRKYSFEDFYKIKAIRTLKELGLSLNEIKEILAHKNKQQDVLYNLYLQLKAVEAKLEELKKTRDVIEDTLNAVIMEKIEDNDIIDVVSYIDQKIEKTTLLYEDLINKWDFDLLAVDYFNKYLSQDKAYIKAIKKVAELIKLHGTDGKIIDVGCGTCVLWENFDNDVYNITALDNCYPMLAIAKENIPWLQYSLGDILDDSVSRLGTFDLVISTFLLHHIPYKMQYTAVKNILSLMKATGKILIVDRMFLNNEDRKNFMQNLFSVNAAKKIEDIESEYYLDLSVIKPYIESKGYLVNSFTIEKEVRLLEIKAVSS